jgi:hypothetical protein
MGSKEFDMKKWHAVLAALGVWGCLGLQQASAQIGSYTPPQTNPHPVFNPYLNMIRGNAAVNYFGIVRPQLATAQALQNLQMGQQYLQSGLTPLGVGDPNLTGTMNNNSLMTGHAVSFMNTTHYFPPPGARFSGGSGSSGIGRTISNTQGPTGYRR